MPELLRAEGEGADRAAPRDVVRERVQVARGRETRKVRYRRADGVDLSGDLHLPRGYDPPRAFVRPSWGSPVFRALRGCAVLGSAQLPAVGDGEKEPNDTFVEQLVANAAAAIDALEKEGIVDPRRCAVTGRSNGAFMAASLLAHSDLSAAGIARSGAYNRSLTPFGFQSEERTCGQAKDVCPRVSPFGSADTIEALLLVHGEADNAPRTFTLQSERLFEAIQGLGGRARLVFFRTRATATPRGSASSTCSGRRAGGSRSGSGTGSRERAAPRRI